MSRPGITYHDVANAAQQLSAQGKNPTIENIRLLTGTGSSTTIAQHLKEWKNRQDHTRLLCLKEKLPEEIVLAMKGLWERVINQAEDKVSAIKQDLEHTLIEFKDRNKKLQEENARWQQQCHQLKQEKEGLASDKLVLEQVIRQLEDEKIALTITNENKIQKLQDKQNHIDELHRQNQQVQANLEHYRAASLEQRMTDKERYEQQQTQLEQTIQKMHHALAQVQQERLAFQQQSQQTIFENDSLKIQLDKLNKQHELMASRVTDTVSELAKKTQDQQHWQERFQTLQGTHDEQNQSVIDLKMQLTMLSQQLETLKGETKEFREQNKALSHEKWLLGQEKSQLEGQLKWMQKSLLNKIEDAKR